MLLCHRVSVTVSSIYKYSAAVFATLFFLRDLQMVTLSYSRVFVPVRSCQPCLTFVGKAMSPTYSASDITHKH
jgi:hypothetical protein